MFCLLPQAADKFIEAIKSGEIKPEELANMTSEERRTVFEKYALPGDAKAVNALFEEKLLLKNQKRGMVTWAKRVSGISQPARRDMISRIERLDKVLNPSEQEQFLHDLASTKLGVDVTRDEAKTIAQLSQEVTRTKEAMASGGDRLDYGRAKVALVNYVDGLKEDARKLGVVGSIKNAPKHPIQTLSSVSGNDKAISASMDDSAIFRQGWKTLWTHPGIWQRNARKSFVDLVRTYGGRPVMDETIAEISSRPTYDKMIKGKLAIVAHEEAFPTSIPEKFPVFGRFYKASEYAYTAFVQRTRADVFDKYLEIADKDGVNTENTKELQAIGTLVNSLTGRGKLGVLEPIGGHVNNIFFSPRFVKSQFDVLTAHATDSKMTPFARKQAAINLVKVIAGTAAVLGTARAVNPGSVELDPTSTNFGKIKVGATTFDVTGGAASLVVLAARLAEGREITSSGNKTSLTSGKFGQPTRIDALVNYMEGKTAPAVSLVTDLMRGHTFSGGKLTVEGEFTSHFVPLGFQNYQELTSNPKAANVVLGMIADSLGISVNTPQQNKAHLDPAKFSKLTLSTQWTTLQGATAEQIKALDVNKVVQKAQRDLKSKKTTAATKATAQKIIQKYGH